MIRMEFVLLINIFSQLNYGICTLSYIEPNIFFFFCPSHFFPPFHFPHSAAMMRFKLILGWSNVMTLVIYILKQTPHTYNHKHAKNNHLRFQCRCHLMVTNGIKCYMLHKSLSIQLSTILDCPLGRA